MKQTIIRINRVSDIDTSRISVYDLNNRYIDSQGNMYGLRYNKALRKIEVIKIIRAHDKTAASLQQQIMRKRREAEDIPSVVHFEEPDDEEEKEAFNPDEFVEKAIELLRTHRERLKGIAMNIRNSNIIPKDNKTESNQLEDMFRNIDIDGIQAIDALLAYQKELQSYPRSLTYYQSKMDERGRQIIETLAGSNRKVLRFIYFAEMLDNLRRICRAVVQLLGSLSEFLADKDPDEAKWMTAHERQAFRDGLVSVGTTISEAERLMDDLTKLEEYTYRIENY